MAPVCCASQGIPLLWYLQDSRFVAVLPSDSSRQGGRASAAAVWLQLLCLVDRLDLTMPTHLAHQGTCERS